MKKPKIFIACDTTSLKKVKQIINHSKTNKIKIGYKFGLEFMNSKKGRQFISTLKGKIIFVSSVPVVVAFKIPFSTSVLNFLRLFIIVGEALFPNFSKAFINLLVGFSTKILENNLIGL